MFVLFIIWITVFSLIYYLRTRRFRSLAAKLPGPKPYPLVGNALMFLGSPEKTFLSLVAVTQSYNRLAAIWLGPKLHVIIFNYKDIETVLKSKYTNKADEYQLLKPWLGDSILISEGKKFKKNKKMIISAFHAQNIKNYLNIFNEQANTLVDNLRHQVNGDEFDVFPELSHLTLFVLLETSIGVNRDTIGMKANTYINAIEKLTRFIIMRVYKIWLRADIVFKHSSLKKLQNKYLTIVHSLAERVIKERQKEFRNGNNNNWPIFLDKFLEARDESGNGFTNEEIRGELMTILFGGQDTTSISLSFCLCLLGLYQDVQDKVYEELEQVFGNSDRLITDEDCKSLQYLEQIIQETWRLYPPIPVIGKKSTDEIPLRDGLIIPKGCSIGLFIMNMHRDPNVFPKPHKFNPDNFHPDVVKTRSSSAFLPFSAGTRTCIGQRYAMQLMKVTLASVLRKYKISATIPQKDYKLIGQVSLKRYGGFPISLTERIK